MRIRFKAGEERRGSLFFADNFLEFHSKVKSNTIEIERGGDRWGGRKPDQPSTVMLTSIKTSMHIKDH